jgi:hypothetical protein
MWKMEKEDDYLRRADRFSKKHRREWVAVHDNLDTYYKALLQGAKPLQIKFGFMHNEPQGVVAIDQKGGGKSLMQTRLYVFPFVEKEVLHLITIGDKTTQSADLATCRNFVSSIRTPKLENG